VNHKEKSHVANTINTPPGLEATSWFLLAIAASLAGIPFFTGMAISWYLETTATKKGE